MVRNYKNKCYAHSFENCSGGISREHYISSGVLKLIGRSIDVSGHSWLKGKTKKLSPSALTSKILCRHHNNQLSNLDDIAIDLFGTLKRFDQELGSDNSVNEIKIFSGHMIERWFIKLYLGLHYSEQFQSKPYNIEPYLLENLFHDVRLPNNFGLYFGLPLGSKVRFFNGLGVSTFLSQTREVCAIACEIVGLPFYISIRPGKPEGTGMIEAPAQYHPVGIELKNKCHSVTKEVKFSW